MQGSPHKGSAHSPLKIRPEPAVTAAREKVPKTDEKIFISKDRKEVFYFGFLVIHLSCIRHIVVSKIDEPFSVPAALLRRDSEGKNKKRDT